MGSGREIPMVFFTVSSTVAPTGTSFHMVPVMGPKSAAASYAVFCWAAVLSGGRSASWFFQAMVSSVTRRERPANRSVWYWSIAACCKRPLVSSVNAVTVTP